jgi:transcriptional regulator with XRE-family HTH domain
MSSKKNPHIEKNLGSRLRSYRKEKKLTSLEMAAKLGISQGTLSDLENDNTTPSADTIASLVRNTDIDLKWLFTGQETLYNKDRVETLRQVQEGIYNKDRMDHAVSADLGDLLKMTTAILMSPTEYSGSLAANIKSFYRSLEMEKRTAKLEGECDELRKRVAALEDALKLVSPQAEPEEAAA